MCVDVCQMDTVVNPLRSIVRSMPDNFADGIARVSGGFRSIPNNMLDGVGKMLNVKGVRIVVLHADSGCSLTALYLEVSALTR